TSFNGGPDNLCGLSPAVWQEPDGSVRMWIGHKTATFDLSMYLYESSDGVGFDLVGQVDLGLPKNLWGPWHFDVIRVSGLYWMAGSFGALLPGATSIRDLYMLRSEDGLQFRLLFPTVLERATSDHWFSTGTSRPSMLYVPGHGLEFYVGSNARHSCQPGYGGTGRWLDPGWDPGQPRPLSESIGTVFWGSARDFVDDPRSWPHPWYEVDNASHSTTLEHDGSVVTVVADSPSVPMGRMNSIFIRPQNHEYHMKLK
ncbi:unnamed protein product, partial [marine sediment metagenome]